MFCSGYDEYYNSCFRSDFYDSTVECTNGGCDACLVEDSKLTCDATGVHVGPGWHGWPCGYGMSVERSEVVAKGLGFDRSVCREVDGVKLYTTITYPPFRGVPSLGAPGFFASSVSCEIPPDVLEFTDACSDVPAPKLMSPCGSNLRLASNCICCDGPGCSYFDGESDLSLPLACDDYENRCRSFEGDRIFNASCGEQGLKMCAGFGACYPSSEGGCSNKRELQPIRTRQECIEADPEGFWLDPAWLYEEYNAYIGGDVEKPDFGPYCISNHVELPGTSDCELGTYFGAVWGDPHIQTLGGQQYECQVQGEVVLAQSNRLRAHGLFTKVGEQKWFSVMTSVAFQAAGFPNIQVSTKMASDATPVDENLGGCEVSLLVNKQTGLYGLEEGGSLPDDFVRIDIDRQLPAQMSVAFNDGSLDVTLIFQQFQGVCYISGYFKMMHCKSEKVIGAFGSTDGAPWVDAPDGNVLTIPDTPGVFIFKDAYDHCANNWCLGPDKEFESIMEYDGAFYDFSGCDIPYSNPFDPLPSRRGLNAMVDAEILAICGDSIPCQMDGLVFGAAGAEAYLDELSRMADIRASIPSSAPTGLPTTTPTVEPTKNSTTTPTVGPTKNPTTTPTVSPTENPSPPPAVEPTHSPTRTPTVSPTKNPSPQPATQIPSLAEEGSVPEDAGDAGSGCTDFFLICFFRWLISVITFGLL